MTGMNQHLLGQEPEDCCETSCFTDRWVHCRACVEANGPRAAELAKSGRDFHPPM